MKEKFLTVLKQMEQVGLTEHIISLGEEEIQRLKLDNPGIPSDYVSYLREIGYGPIGNIYMVYGGLTSPVEIFGVRGDANLENIVLIGDGFSGDCEGFLMGETWELVSINHVNLKVYKLETSFEKFIKKKIKLALKVYKKTGFKL